MGCCGGVRGVLCVHIWLITRLFRAVLDDNGDGSISLQELQDALGLEDAEAMEVFNEADLNGDGAIDFEEFTYAMKGTLGAKKIQKDQLFTGMAPVQADKPAMVQLEIAESEHGK